MVTIEELGANKNLEEKYASSILLHKDDYEKYLYSPKVEIPNAYNEVLKFYVSKKLIRDILSNPFYFDRLKTAFFKENKQSFYVYEFRDGNLKASLSFTKAQFTYCLENLLNSGELNLDEQKEQIVTEIIRLTSLNQMYKDYESKLFEIEIDKRDFKINTSVFLKALSLDCLEFKNYVWSEASALNMMPQEFTYALKKFLEITRIESLYNLPIEMRRNIVQNLSYDTIDYESINKITESNDNVVNEIDINLLLRDKVTENILDNAPLLKKAILIYYNLCKILTYDPEFYATDRKGPSALKHLDKKRIATITPQNNEIVCYEFIAIYSKLLQELGINCKTISTGSNDYGTGHTFLEFRVGEFLIKADPTSHMLTGDLLQAKIGKSLTSLTCLNQSKITKSLFAGEVSNVLEESKSQVENKALSKKKKSEFDFALSQYRKELKNKKVSVTFATKLDMLLKQISECGFDYFEAIQYALFLKLTIFNDDEIRNNIDCTIIRDAKADDKKLATPILIITVNDKSFLDEANRNIYLYFRPPTTLRVIQKEDIEVLFEEDQFAYIKSSTKIIPGLILGGR